MGIDDVLALVATHTGRDELLLGLESGEPFVLEGDGHVADLAEIARHGPGRLGAGALRSVHIDWQANDHRLGLAFVIELEHALRVLAKLGPFDGFHGHRNAARSPTGCNTDCLGSRVQGDQGALGQFCEFENGHGVCLRRFVGHASRTLANPPCEGLPPSRAKMHKRPAFRRQIPAEPRLFLAPAKSPCYSLRFDYPE